MTAINLSTDIPSGIATLEELAAWVALSLNNIARTVTAVEGQGYTTEAAQAGIFYVPTSGKTRLIARLSLEINPDYVGGGQKPWKFVQPLTATAIPAAFKSN